LAHRVRRFKPFRLQRKMSADPVKQVLLDCFMQQRARLRAVAKRTLFGSEYVDDVLHDAYLRLLTAPASAEPVRNPLSYCVRVVQNVALDHCRRKLKEEAELEAAVDIETLVAHGSEHLPDSTFRRVQHRRRLEQRLARLRPQVRQAFVLRYFHGHSQRDIAAALNCALGSVGNLLKQSLRGLGVRASVGPSVFKEAEDSR
jgi:RNA polymerase sigma-70 factor (ECF subfamily)